MSEIEERNMVISFILNQAAPGDLKFIIDAYEKRESGGRAKVNLELHKIAGKKDLLRAVNWILNKMPGEDQVLVKSALAKRMDKKRAGAATGNGLPGDLVLGMGMQMGSAMKAIHKGARMLAADIILQHDPDIPVKHLEVLLDKWVPVPGAKKKGAPVPADIMLTMIEQFVAYGTGSMKKEDLKKFPAGWAEKYWDAFSTDTQKLISSYLHNEIDRDAFWAAVKHLLAGGAHGF